jgi:predicted RNase H-like HicB family nuclease
MRYAVVIEQGAKGFGAYVPDLPATDSSVFFQPSIN